MNQRSLIGVLVPAVAIVTFAIKNSSKMDVKFIGWQFHSLLDVVILISTAVAVNMMALLRLPDTYRLRARLKERTQRITESEHRDREFGSRNV